MSRRFYWLSQVVVLTAGVLVGGCIVTQSQDTPVDHEKTVEQVTDNPYYIYVPSTYKDRKKPLPLVITLHGTRPWDTAFLQIREWKKLAEDQKFIVVVPELDSSQGILPVIPSSWRKDLQRDEQAILAIRREVLNRYDIDRKRILLTGFSAGGLPMYYVGLRNPDKFSVLVARACNSKPELFAWANIGADTRRIPISIFFGRDDAQMIKDQSWEAFRWLRQNGWNKNNCVLDKNQGGHLRRPETAYSEFLQFVGRS